MIVQVVDENDNFLYYKNADERDRRKEITRSAALWVINEKKEILVARRSNRKWHFPHRWGPSVEGMLEEGETYESNIKKEAKEEIGLEVIELIISDKKRESDDHEFFNQYFFTHTASNTKFKFEDHEVDKVRWISLDNLKIWYKEKQNDFIPDFESSLEVLENHSKGVFKNSK